MMNVVCNCEIRGFLTRGKSYEVVSENEKNFIVVDDSGYELGYSKSRFNVLSKKEYSMSDLITAIDMARVIVDGKYAHSSEEIFQLINKSTYNVKAKERVGQGA